MTGKNGEIAFEKPVVYQLKSGAPTVREEVKGKFSLLTANTVGFSLGSYDRSRSIVIDPILAYSTYVGGRGDEDGDGDFATGIAVDSSGAVYITGITQSTDFPVTANAFQTEDNEVGDSSSVYPTIFVRKLNATGTALVYSTFLGGNDNEDEGQGIAVDASGDAYVTGWSTATDFPTTPGAYEIHKDGSLATRNAFVTKLSSDGSALIYSTYLGGSGGSVGSGIAIDASGNAYVAGSAGTDFPTTPGAYQTTDRAAAQNSTNAFITKLNAEGTGLLYSTYLGGSGLSVGGIRPLGLPLTLRGTLM